jgi:hypothetical protein
MMITRARARPRDPRHRRAAKGFTLRADLETIKDDAPEIGKLFVSVSEEIAKQSPFLDDADLAAVIDEELRHALSRFSIHLPEGWRK